MSNDKMLFISEINRNQITLSVPRYAKLPLGENEFGFNVERETQRGVPKRSLADATSPTLTLSIAQKTNLSIAFTKQF